MMLVRYKVNKNKIVYFMWYIFKEKKWIFYINYVINK